MPIALTGVPESCFSVPISAEFTSFLLKNVRLEEAAVMQALVTTEFAMAHLDQLEVVFHRDYRLYEDRIRHKGYLQKLPELVAGVT